MNRIGLVGKGFVGEAFYEGMKDHYEIDVWDTDPSKTTVSSLKEVVINNMVIFVSVPTPMNLSTGECDLSILDSVLRDIHDLSLQIKEDKAVKATHKYIDTVVVIRSTIPPGTTQKFAEKYMQKLTLVFNPEFLTEANYINDFKNQNRIVLGGAQVPAPSGGTHGTGVVAHIYSQVFPSVPVVQTNSTTAEFVKYFANCFLATKVTFVNEMAQIVDAMGIDHNAVAKIAALDPRIGTSHLMVPGPDGHKGFGGTCVPGQTEVKLYPNGCMRIDELYKLQEAGLPLPMIKSTNWTVDDIEPAKLQLVTSREAPEFETIMLTFHLKNDKSFTCTEDHLLPIIRDGALYLSQAKYIKETDLLFMDDG